jgi:hypothetical protein
MNIRFITSVLHSCVLLALSSGLVENYIFTFFCIRIFSQRSILGSSARKKK